MSTGGVDSDSAGGSGPDQNIAYWMRGGPVQNFGDFLSEFFIEHLFFAQPNPGQRLRIVGSCIDDMFVPPRSERAGGDELVFWGCGLRTADGLSADRREGVDILAVRGPLSRSALRLGSSVPFGDPGLLMPALYKAATVVRQPSTDALLIPHFHDRRSDAELLALSGCDAVLRPNLPNDLTAITEFVDRVVAARFVLAGALHGAIIAAAYGRPFAFWNSGDIDLPFKWTDFAASIAIPCVFHAALPEAEAQYEAEIRPALRIPVLWPLLVAAPMPVRPDAFVSVIAQDVARHGPAALADGPSSWAANRLQTRLQSLLDDARRTIQLGTELAQAQADQAALQSRAEAMLASAERTASELAAREAQLEALQHQAQASQAEQAAAAMRLEDAAAEIAAVRQSMLEQAEEAGALRAEIARAAAEQLGREQAEAEAQAGRDTALARAALAERRLEEVRAREARLRHESEPELARLREREAWLASEEARLHEAVQHRNQANAALLADLQAEQALAAATRASTSWRLTAPLRLLARGGRRGPSVPRGRGQGRLLRLLWWAVTLQLPARLAYRRRVLREVALVAGSPIFDAAAYQAANPQAAGSRLDAARHYVLTGAAAGANPALLFDGAWYRSAYPDSASGGLTPFGHYLLQGAAAGQDPHPLFETAWYAAQHGVPLAEALPHYLRQGAAEGAAPNRLFDPAGYLCEHRDARASGLDAFTHYLTHGIAAGHDPHAFFETAWYVANTPGCRQSGLSPLAHYLRVGAAQGAASTGLLGTLKGFSLDQTLALPERADPEVSIVIPAYGHYFQTLRCLCALAANSGDTVGYETILIDDDPSNSLAPFLAGVPGLRLEQNAENLGFLHSCNRAAGLARGWHIVFLNNDTLVQPGWLAALLQPVRDDPRIGIVGCKLLNADGSIQEAGGILFSDGWGCSFGRGEPAGLPEFNYVREVDVVVGAAFLVRRELFTALGGFDRRYAPAFYEEFDLAFEVRRAGYRVVYQPASAVIHLGSTSYGAEQRDSQSRRNHAQFCLKWAAVLPQQPDRDAPMFLARQVPGDLGTILMIDDKVPEYDRHAGALTVFQYVGLLIGMGMRIVYWPADATARAPYTARLQQMGVEVLYAPVTLAAWLDRHGRHLHAVWTARPDVTAPLLDLLRSTTDAPILYYPHDLHHLREMRRYRLDGDLDALVESNRVRRLEMAIFREVDVVMTPSAAEAAVISAAVPDATVRVIPPYIYPESTTDTPDGPAFATRRDVLFVGGFAHPPNVDAALWLARTIMPLVWRDAPDAHLLLVGDAPTAEIRALAAERVQVTGQVPDLDPWYARARLSAAPLRYGAGVKGKVVSSLQAGIPVVTTAIGNEGIVLEDGTEVLLGETAEVLASAIVRLLADPDLCARMSGAGAAAVRHRFGQGQARAMMQDILGVAVCKVCGSASARDRPVRGRPPGTGDAAGQAGASACCADCGAGEADAKLADAIIHASVRGAVSLREAVRRLARTRIHAFGAGPVVAELQAVPLFTGYPELAPPGPEHERPRPSLRSRVLGAGFAPSELDILIDPDASAAVPDLTDLAEVSRVLKPGGAFICCLADEADRNLVAAASAAGLELSHESVDTECVLTFVKSGDAGPES